VYDITNLLVKGTNILSAEVGEGWWAARLGRPAVGCLFGDRLGFLGQVEVDGKVVGTSNKSWEWSTFDVELGQLYDGEVVDSNLVAEDWWKNPKAEGKVEALDFPKGALQISDAPPVRRVQEIKAVETIMTKSGKMVLDFGQNMVGWLRIDKQIRGNGELLIRHAEVMEHGELGTRPLRTAKAEIRIKLGGQTKGFEPRFTFFGFRYAFVIQYCLY
jgi:alpha-L-rhamnosidase